MLREFVELGRYRLDRGWSYRRLADAINANAKARRSDFRMSLGLLHGLLNDPKRQPNHVTLYAVQRFLAAAKQRDEVTAP